MMYYLSCRVYDGLAHEELNKLESCTLIDEFEQNLKSMENYKAAIDHTFASSHLLRNYTKQYALPMPGDWPTWFYAKKLIAQSPPGSTSTYNQYKAIIPEQGPFHVGLNIREDIIKIYHFVFGKIYKEVFGSELPIKPKPFRSNFVITATLCGWLLIRSKVLAKFNLCKDIEYTCLLNLLDEVLPLAFFQYDCIFRSGKFDRYIDTMGRLALLFMVWERHHYDRSTLSMLSDLMHQKLRFTSYYDLKMEWLSLISEKKVEIWHSLLRYNIRSHYNAEEVRNTALSLAATSNMAEFYSAFIRPYQRGNSGKNMSQIIGRFAEVLLELIKKVATNIGKSKQLPRETTTKGKPKGQPKFHLHTFDAIIDTKALPFSFKEFKVGETCFPNAQMLCDYSDCTVRDKCEVLRLSCCHTLHTSCFIKYDRQCPICTPVILEKAKALTEAFNKSLLTPTHNSSTANSRDTNTAPDENNEENSPNNCKPASYYESREWDAYVDDALSSIVVPQPGEVPQPHPVQSNHNASLNITVMTTTNSKIWMFPSSIAQSTLNTQNGSTACTFIALLNSQAFYRDANQHPDPFELSPCMGVAMISSIVTGNQLHRTATGNRPLYFTVEEAVVHMRAQLPNMCVEEPLDLTFCSENLQVPQSSVAFYLQRLTNDTNMAAVVIINAMSVCFVAHSDTLVVIDSHRHGNLGAFIGKAKVAYVEDFLVTIKQ